MLPSMSLSKLGSLFHIQNITACKPLQFVAHNYHILSAHKTNLKSTKDLVRNSALIRSQHTIGTEDLPEPSPSSAVVKAVSERLETKKRCLQIVERLLGLHGNDQLAFRLQLSRHVAGRSSGSCAVIRQRDSVHMSMACLLVKEAWLKCPPSPSTFQAYLHVQRRFL